MRCAARAATLAGALAALLAVACGRNPALGDWEIDRGESTRGAVLAAEAAGLAALAFESRAIVAGETKIPVQYALEGDVVRVVRGDGRGEHRVEILSDGRIRVDLPIGVSAVYRRAGS